LPSVTLAQRWGLYILLITRSQVHYSYLWKPSFHTY
jgi:hypothetical protein